MKITILGCGAASGVPAITTGWGRCDPANPRNRRRRSSILVEADGATVLVDTSPDLREQLLEAGVRKLDAVLYTHNHGDHIHGLDDLREINRLIGGPIPVYGTPETLGAVEKRFDYAFLGIKPGDSIFRPWLQVRPIAPGESFAVGGLKIDAFGQDHGFSSTLGYRFGGAAYSTDLVDLPPEARAALAGIKIWIVAALQSAPHPTHAHVDKVLGWIADIKPHRAVLTHMSNDLDYEALISHLLPVGVTPAYDGMRIEV